jgi:hypothetical protein
MGCSSTHQVTTKATGYDPIISLHVAVEVAIKPRSPPNNNRLDDGIAIIELDSYAFGFASAP